MTVKAKSQSDKIEHYFREVFGSREGKLVLKEIEDYCGIGKPLWAKDQLGQNANLVKHDVAVWIKDKTKGRV